MSMIFDQDEPGQSEKTKRVKIQFAEMLGLFAGDEKLPYVDAAYCYASIDE